MELVYYLKIIYKRIWLVMLLPIVTAVICAVISLYVIEPVYEAKTTLYILAEDDDKLALFSSEYMQASQQLIKDYGEIIRSRSILKDLISKLNLTGITPETLSEQISVRLKNETRLIEISVRASNPEETKLLADEVTKTFIEKTGQLTKTGNIEIIDEAEVPGSPVKPKPKINTIIGAFIGLAAALGAVLVMDAMDKTIKSVEDVETQLGLVVLGTIPSLNIK